MGFIVDIFNTFLYQPLFNALILLYQYIPGHDFGIAIIALTILIKFVFYPLGNKAIKSQKALSELQPKVKEVQEKYKDNREVQAREIMALYKKEKVSPFSGILLLLVQLPVLVALYRVFWQGLNPEQMTLLYSFVPSPEMINPMFLGIVNLSQPNMILAVLAGIGQYFQVKMSGMNMVGKNSKSVGNKPDMSKIMQTQMKYFLPVFTVSILFRLPSAIGLYWVVTTLFTIIQQTFFLKKEKLANKNN
ncbi:MAG: YidC/Oxa1 family membrane protein insertase [Candidatus Nealsonbacteria bacterium]